MKKFWIVMSESRGLSHSPYRHTTELDAFREAERLASQYGGKFWVTEARGVAVKQDVVTLKFEGNDEIPF